MKKSICFVMALAGALMPMLASAVIDGSCESTAVSVSDGRKITVVRAYDESTSSYTSNYVYYLKVTLKRSNAYTVYLQNENGNILIDSIYAMDSEEEETFPPGASFWNITVGSSVYWWMPTDEWTYDPEFPEFNDPESWTYYIYLRGDVGASANIVFKQGVKLPPGIEENPVRITPKVGEVQTLTSSDEYKLRGGQFYMNAKLSGGRRYMFSLTGGTEADPLKLSVYGSGRSNSYTDGQGREWLSFVPETDDGDEESSYTKIVVIGATNSAAQFSVDYTMLANRTPAEHDSTALNLGDSTTFVPGRICAAGSNYYDEIIDEQLFAVDLVKNERYSFVTVGAKTNLLMRVYDDEGTILYSNVGVAGDLDCLVAFAASGTGKYYVGVCQYLSNDDTGVLLGEPVTLKFESAEPVEGSPDQWDSGDDDEYGASALTVAPGSAKVSAKVSDKTGHGWHQLGRTDWMDTFVIGGRKGLTYRFAVSTESSVVGKTLSAKIYYVANDGVRYIVKTTGDLKVGTTNELAFTATADKAYYLRVTCLNGQGVSFPNYKIHASGYDASGTDYGSLKVDIVGAGSATWSIGGQSGSYPAGASVLLPAGGYVVKFSSVEGFSTPSSETVAVLSGEVKEITAEYNDSYDPKDDTEKGATAWKLGNDETTLERTLWHDDEADHFSFTAKAGQYYDFELDQKARADGDTSDAVFSIYLSGVPVVENVTSVRRRLFGAGKYILKVEHSSERENNNCSYSISGYYATVGQVKFAKTAISVKENVSKATLTVKRTQKEGKVRIRYATEDGTGVAGENYVAQSGELSWESGDGSAKTISIRLIPKLRAHYTGANPYFTVKLSPVPDGELEADEYSADISGDDEATVTMTEVSKVGTTEASNYKTIATATTKTEDVALRSGTFYSVLEATDKGAEPMTGMSAIASLVLTVSAKDKSSTAKDSVTAKVTIAGKTYSMKESGEWDEETAEKKTRTMAFSPTIDGETCDSELKITVADGETSDDDAWLLAGGSVEMSMAIPDSNGGETNVVYTGSLGRDNAKIQDYLTEEVKFAGYYTLALVPPTTSAKLGDTPCGNGYLTLTVDNKGKAKTVGKLVDGTAVSLSSVGRLVKADDSRNGYAFEIPLYVAKSTYCFGGTLRLFSEQTEDYDRHTITDMIKVDSSRRLVWNNDNPLATYSSTAGFAYDITPVGGYFDTVINLQTYYIDYATSVDTATVSEFPSETFSYMPVETQQPNGSAVEIAANALTTLKRVMVKNSLTSLYDFEESVNPANVQIKLARATGIVTGSFSVWEESSTVQREIKGMKHFGILLLARDDFSCEDPDVLAVLPESIACAGFFNYSLKITPGSGISARKWTFAAPFNVKASELVK